MARVLLADSQPLFNEALEALFSRDDAHQVIGRSSSAEETFAMVGQLRPDLVLIDLCVSGSDGQTRLEVSELDIWAEPLGQGARRVLGEVLATRLLPRGIDVIAAGDRQGDMELAVALERLDGDTPGTARLQARWQLSRGGEALDRGIYAASEDAGMSSASLVAAQSRLLQGLGEHLAERLLPRLKAGR